MEHAVLVQIRDGKAIGDDANDGRDGNDNEGNLGGSDSARKAGAAAQAVVEDPGPEEVELLLHAERPEVFERPHGEVGGVIAKEEEGADDIDPGNGEPTRPPQKHKDGHVEVDGRQDAHGAPEVEAAHADRAALLLLVEQKAGDEVAADNKEDEDAGVAVED